jgi:hypothetical protein
VHQLLHVAILASTIMGVAALALLVLWPVIFETPLAGRTQAFLIASVGIAGFLLLLEWRVVH